MDVREPSVSFLSNRLSAWHQRADGVLEWELHDQETGKVLHEGTAEPHQITWEDIPKDDPESCKCPNCKVVPRTPRAVPYVWLRYYCQVVAETDGAWDPQYGMWMTIVWLNEKGLAEVRDDAGPFYSVDDWRLLRVPEELFGVFYRHLLPGEPGCPPDPGCPWAKNWCEPTEVPKWVLMDKTVVYVINGQHIAFTKLYGVLFGSDAIEHIASAGGIRDQIPSRKVEQKEPEEKPLIRRTYASLQLVQQDDAGWIASFADGRAGGGFGSTASEALHNLSNIVEACLDKEVPSDVPGEYEDAGDFAIRQAHEREGD